MTISYREIPYSEYLLQPTLALPSIGTYYLQQSLGKNGVLWGAFHGEQLVGLTILELAGEPLISYLYVKDPYRGHRIGRGLIRAALAAMKERQQISVRASVVMESNYGKAADVILQKEGFELVDTATIIRYARGEECSRQWNVFLEKRGKKIIRYLGRRGYVTLSFGEASAAEVESLLLSIGEDFPSNLNPDRFLHNPNDRLVPDYSFITLKDRKPVAFVIATTADDKTLVFQQISTAFRHRDNGVFLLPFAAFMTSFLEGEHFSKVSAVIWDHNEPMQRQVQHFIGSMAESMKTQNNYRAVIAESQR